MKKLFGLAIFLAAVVSMSAALSGCKTEEKADEAAKAKQKEREEAEKAKTEVKLKTEKLELKAKAKDQKVEIEITEKAGDKIEFSISGKNVIGAGTVAKDATKGEANISTDDAADGVEITFTVTGEKYKGGPKLKATIK